MKDLFNESDRQIRDLFEYFSEMFDPRKKAEILRLAEIEAEIKKVQSEE